MVLLVACFSFVMIGGFLFFKFRLSTDHAFQRAIILFFLISKSLLIFLLQDFKPLLLYEDRHYHNYMKFCEFRSTVVYLVTVLNDLRRVKLPKLRY